MSEWQYCSNNGSVFRNTPDGGMESRSILDPEIADLLANGYVPLPDPEMALDRVKLQKLEKVNREINAYIYQHYDAGTQSTFNAITTLCTLGLIDPATPVPMADALKAKINRIKEVMTWVNSVLAYYYMVKTYMQAATTQAELDAITCNFSPFDATDPLVTIPEIR